MKCKECDQEIKEPPPPMYQLYDREKGTTITYTVNEVKDIIPGLLKFIKDYDN